MRTKRNDQGRWHLSKVWGNDITLFDIFFESCEAQVLINKEDDIKIASIQGIGSKIEGKGHAKGCILKIEKLAKAQKCDEIWWPTVINPKLENLLAKLGYKFVNFGKHPMMPDGEDVLGYKKTLK